MARNRSNKHTRIFTYGPLGKDPKHLHGRTYDATTPRSGRSRSISSGTTRKLLRLSSSRAARRRGLF